VEFSKQELTNINDESLSRKATQQVLMKVLNIILKLLHPFMPFITEEIWQKLPGNKGSIMISPLPRKNDSLINLPAEEALEIIKEVVVSYS
jgi:valyl-tRNA synthetase